MPLYFSYGSNMDIAGMTARCPRSKPIGAARLMRHRLAIMREGWLTVIRDPSSIVYGVLWDLALSDVGALDRHEGVGQGLYAKAQQIVIASGGRKQALIYLGANAGPGVANRDYIRIVLAAAEFWRLPRSTLSALARFAAGEALTAAPLRRGN